MDEAGRRADQHGGETRNERILLSGYRAGEGSPRLPAKFRERGFALKPAIQQCSAVNVNGADVPVCLKDYFSFGNQLTVGEII